MGKEKFIVTLQVLHFAEEIGNMATQLQLGNLMFMNVEAIVEEGKGKTEECSIPEAVVQ